MSASAGPSDGRANTADAALNVVFVTLAASWRDEATGLRGAVAETLAREAPVRLAIGPARHARHHALGVCGPRDDERVIRPRGRRLVAPRLKVGLCVSWGGHDSDYRVKETKGSYI